MGEVTIKEIITFKENNINKTKMVITENGADKEIILEGKGSVKAVIQV